MASKSIIYIQAIIWIITTIHDTLSRYDVGANHTQSAPASSSTSPGLEWVWYQCKNQSCNHPIPKPEKLIHIGKHLEHCARPHDAAFMCITQSKLSQIHTLHNDTSTGLQVIICNQAVIWNTSAPHMTLSWYYLGTKSTHSAPVGPIPVMDWSGCEHIVNTQATTTPSQGLKNLHIHIGKHLKHCSGTFDSAFTYILDQILTAFNLMSHICEP